MGGCFGQYGNAKREDAQTVEYDRVVVEEAEDTDAECVDCSVGNEECSVDSECLAG